MSEGKNRQRIRAEFKQALLAAAVAVMGGVLAAPVQAVDRTWLTATTGSFNTGSNWSGSAVPGAADNAIFDKAGTYTVNFTTAPTNTNLTITNSTLTFARTSGSGNYTLSGFALVN